MVVDMLRRWLRRSPPPEPAWGDTGPGDRPGGYGITGSGGYASGGFSGGGSVH
jgi:hypothetical protein